MVGIGGKTLRQLIAACLLNLLTAARGSLRISAALVGFVYDDQIPPLLPNPLAYIFLFCVIKRRDDLCSSLPGIHELLLINGRKDHLEWFAEPS